jgi:hypothetical protein
MPFRCFHRSRRLLFFAPAVLLFASMSHAKLYEVGPSKAHTLPSQVSVLVSDGDTVAIDAGSYVDCATWTKDNLVLKGVGGFAHLRDKACGGKAIWIIQGKNTTVENIEFSGASVPDQNGAGIRQEGTNLVVRHCYFHDNENGILAGADTASSILIEYSEFANNGYGDGYSHNMYIGNIGSFTIQYCYVHHARIGHEIKSRARTNFLLYNRISNEAAGTASRNIDLPNGGLAVIIGNIIHHGPTAENSNVCGYGLEGMSNPIKSLYIAGNTFVNERSTGLFINIPSSGVDTLRVVNNVFAGKGTFLSGRASVLDSTANAIMPDLSQAQFVDNAGYDFHLKDSSPLIDKGTGNPGNAGALSLLPLFEYVHPVAMKPRLNLRAPDIGAFENNTSMGCYFPPSARLQFELFQNAPNPFTGKTVIRCAVGSAQMAEAPFGEGYPVTLRVVDILGSSVATLADQSLPGGMYAFTFQPRDLQSGLYFCILSIGRETQTRAMLYLR